MFKIEPDAILCQVETALDKLTDLILSIRSTGQKPAVYRQILRRRIHLTNVSKQLRGENGINIRNN